MFSEEQKEENELPKKYQKAKEIHKNSIERSIYYISIRLFIICKPKPF